MILFATGKDALFERKLFGSMIRRPKQVLVTRTGVRENGANVSGLKISTL